MTANLGSSIRNGILSLPRNNLPETTVMATPKRIYSNAHAYHINSISCNSDGETFLSADDLRINWWNTEISSSCFSTFPSLVIFLDNNIPPFILSLFLVDIVDIKPPNMEELTEVITSAQFHPQHCNIIMYSSSRGSIKLGDTRSSALCDVCAKVFEV
jgi:serine/threonine-protein phosphatase 2A regulatory subunit B